MKNICNGKNSQCSGVFWPKHETQLSVGCFARLKFFYGKRLCLFNFDRPAKTSKELSLQQLLEKIYDNSSHKFFSDERKRWRRNFKKTMKKSWNLCECILKYIFHVNFTNEAEHWRASRHSALRSAFLLHYYFFVVENLARITRQKSSFSLSPSKRENWKRRERMCSCALF